MDINGFILSHQESCNVVMQAEQPQTNEQVSRTNMPSVCQFALRRHNISRLQFQSIPNNVHNLNKTIKWVNQLTDQEALLWRPRNSLTLHTVSIKNNNNINPCLHNNSWGDNVVISISPHNKRSSRLASQKANLYYYSAFQNQCFSASQSQNTQQSRYKKHTNIKHDISFNKNANM